MIIGCRIIGNITVNNQQELANLAITCESIKFGLIQFNQDYLIQKLLRSKQFRSKTLILQRSVHVRRLLREVVVEKNY